MPRMNLGGDLGTPAKFISSSDTEFTAGFGIDSEQLSENTIAVSDDMLYNVSSQASSLVEHNAVSGTSRSVPGMLVIGQTAYAQTQNSVVLGTAASGYANASASDYRGLVAIGYDANAYSNAIAIGPETVAGIRNIVIGNRAWTLSTSTNNIVIGMFDSNDTKARPNSNSVVIGSDSRPQAADSSVIIGYSAGCSTASASPTSPDHCVIIGKSAVGSGIQAVAVGDQAQATTSSVAVGKNASVSLSNGISIGYGSVCGGNGTYGVAIGSSASSYASYGTAVGCSAYISSLSSYSVALGAGARVNHSDAWSSIQIGNGTTSAQKTFSVGFVNRSQTSQNVNYVLLQDGLIPKERLSGTTPNGGQVLYYDDTTETLSWKTVSEEFPIATRNSLGMVKIGSGLTINNAGLLSATVDNISWGKITGTLSNQTDLNNALNQKIPQLTTMPTADESQANRIVQFVGTSSSQFQNGYFYKCTQVAGSTYAWSRYDVQPGTTVINNLTSTSTTSALSAAQGKLLKESIENISTIGRFLAMWDATDGSARYLSYVPFTYEAGDYFIVSNANPSTVQTKVRYTGSGTVSTPRVSNVELWESIYGDDTLTMTFTYNSSGKPVDENGTVYNGMASVGVTFTGNPAVGGVFTVEYTSNKNYKPDGTVYTAPSTTLDTENQVELSDMYYYTGMYWVFMANHSRSIAIDGDLAGHGVIPADSANPVENRVVTAAIEGKVSASNSPNIIYVNDDTGVPTTIDVGEGLAIEDGELINTNTSAVWGNIESPSGGDITAQEDLIDYIADYVASHSSSSTSVGVPQLSCVTTQNDSKLGMSLNIEKDYKYDFSRILFTTNMSRDQLIDSMNDWYISVSRWTIRPDTAIKYTSGGSTHHANVRKKRKFTVMNDKFLKTTHRMYCWRYEDDTSYAESDPRRYYYYYTPNYYQNDTALVNANIPFYASLGFDMTSDYAMNMNILRLNGEMSGAYSVGNFQRYEEGDVNTIVKSSKYITKHYFNGVWQCRKMRQGENVYFMWSLEWNDKNDPDIDETDIYVYMVVDDNDQPIPNKPANFFDELGYNDTYTLAYVKSQYTLAEKRYEMNFLNFNDDDYSIEDLLSDEDVLYDTIKDDYDSGRENIYWNTYWFDYPIVPTLLADCKIRVQKNPKNGTPLAGSFIKLKDAVDSELIYDTDYFDENAPIVFLMPWDTTYLLMRMCGWQKHAFNQGYWGEKNNFRFAMHDMHCLQMRGFAGRTREFFHYHQNAKMWKPLEFNLLDPVAVYSGVPSKSTPIQKQLVVTYSGYQSLR